jgi:hypothetical protein
MQIRREQMMKTAKEAYCLETQDVARGDLFALEPGRRVGKGECKETQDDRGDDAKGVGPSRCTKIQASLGSSLPSHERRDLPNELFRNKKTTTN